MSGELAAVREGGEAGIHETQEKFSALRDEMDSVITQSSQFRYDLREQLSEERRAMQEQSAAQLQATLSQFREELRQGVNDAAAAAASVTDSAIETHTAPLRAAVEAKDREIAELRARLTGHDEATLDLLQGMGEICRRAAQRIAGPPAPPSESSEGGAEPQAGAPAQDPGPAESAGDVPGFAQSQPPGKLWRVPLVSSLVLTTGAVWMLHYLH